MLILGHREGVLWVLQNSRMAFPQTHRSDIDHISVDDELFMLTTRGCWRNPTRDRSRIIGCARVTSPVQSCDPPLEIAGRELTRACDIAIEQLAPYPSGVELPPLIFQMQTFPNKPMWSMSLRRTLLKLAPNDAVLLRRKLDIIGQDPIEAIRTYVDRMRRSGRGRSSAAMAD